MSRRTLMGSTALVAAGLLCAPALAADPIKLELRGYLQTFITAGHIDRDVVGTTGTSYRAVTFRYEGEIWFTGMTKLDNGTTVGVRIELEGWSQNTGVSAASPTGTFDQFDEEYLFAFGDWGRIEFGGTDAASYKMQFSSQSALLGWGFHDPTPLNRGTGYAAANNGGRSGVTTGLGASLINSGDANKFTYITPRFAGFQFGFSYTPSFSATAGTARCASRAGGGNFNNCPRNDNTWKSAIDVAGNYVNRFGDVTVRLYGGYVTAGFDRGTVTPDGLAGGTAINTAGRWKSWAGGAQISYAGFTLGGGLGRDNNGLRGNNATRWYTGSLLYERGPWQVSLAWWGGRNNDGTAIIAGAQNAPGKDKHDIIEFGANYLLSPGIKLNGGLNYVRGSGQSKSEKADAWAVIFGTVFTF